MRRVLDSPYERMKAALIHAARNKKLGLGIAGFCICFIFAVAIVGILFGVKAGFWLFVIPVFAGCGGWKFFTKHDFYRSGRNALQFLKLSYAEKTRTRSQRISFVVQTIGLVSLAAQITVYVATRHSSSMLLILSTTLIVGGLFESALYRTAAKLKHWINHGSQSP